MKCGICGSLVANTYIKNYFLLKYQHIFKTERCREGKEIVTRGCRLILHQILSARIIGKAIMTVRRIAILMLGVKRLNV